MEAAQKTGRPWYLYALSVIPFLAGLAACVLLGIKVWQGFVQFDKSLLRVVVPGEKMIALPNPGNYTIFHEHKTIVDGIVYSSSEDSISGLSCTMKDGRTGADVHLKPSTANLNYSFGSTEGRSVFDFSAAQSGAYRISCVFPDAGQKSHKIVLAVGQGFGAEIFNTISIVFGIIGIFIVSFGVTAGLIVYLIVKKPEAQAT